jgi:hypothetical protein
VSADTADLIETLIRSALTEPDNWDELRVRSLGGAMNW